MKRFFALLLAAVMLLTLVACGNETKPEKENGDNTQATKKPQSSDTQEKGDDVFEGKVTEAAVRNYKTADESDFSYDTYEDGIRITDYLGTDTVVVIPESIDGKQVRSIAAVVFGNDSSVKGVCVPSGVKEMMGVFTNNDDLEVVIWESAEVIKHNMFNNCVNLRTVVLGDTLREIHENAFSMCKNLEELFVAPTVEEVDVSAALSIFLGCKKLTIKGEAGSYIESFCAEQGIKFEAV